MYNSLVNQLNDVERPLLKKKITRMDESLKAGINDFKWQAPKITEEFINPVYNIVKDAHDIMLAMKNNCSNIEGILKKQRIPILEKSKKTTNVLDFMTQHSAMSDSILTDMQRELKKIHDEHKKT